MAGPAGPARSPVVDVVVVVCETMDSQRKLKGD
jgi:hypothetical protein